MGDTSLQPHLRAIAAQIVSAHVAHNAVPADTLPALIVSVYNAVAAVGFALARRLARSTLVIDSCTTRKQAIERSGAIYDRRNGRAG